jgi:hypothetical protein
MKHPDQAVSMDNAKLARKLSKRKSYKDDERSVRFRKDRRVVMKIYVASSWRNDLQPEVVRRLREADHSVYDFRNPAPGDHGFSWKQVHQNPPPWSAEDTRATLHHPVAQHGFDLDFGAMQWADAIVMVQPCGRSAALELGWGAGAGKLCIALLADGQEPELMLKVAKLCVSVEEVIEVLEDREEQVLAF